MHLIRDMNEDLWDAPFDTELETLAHAFKELLAPIIQAIDRYGLKRWHLKRFVHDVERFYRRAITDKAYSSEVAHKYQKRFERYRTALFTFLADDGVPWHNNMAERAIRCLAIQRKISGTLFETMATDYLRLVGIAQTCRFQEKSLLKFLTSGEKDVDAFAMVGKYRSSAKKTRN